MTPNVVWFLEMAPNVWVKNIRDAMRLDDAQGKKQFGAPMFET